MLSTGWGWGGGYRQTDNIQQQKVNDPNTKTITAMRSAGGGGGGHRGGIGGGQAGGIIHYM